MDINYNASTPSPARSQARTSPPPIRRAATNTPLTVAAESSIVARLPLALPSLPSRNQGSPRDVGGLEEARQINLQPRRSNIPDTPDFSFVSENAHTAIMGNGSPPSPITGNDADQNLNINLPILPELRLSPTRGQPQQRNSGHTISYVAPPLSPAQSDSSVEM